MACFLGYLEKLQCMKKKLLKMIIKISVLHMKDKHTYGENMARKGRTKVVFKVSFVVICQVKRLIGFLVSMTCLLLKTLLISPSCFGIIKKFDILKILQLI